MAATTSIRTWRERRDEGHTDDAIDLKRFWREHEAAIGIRSNFGSMLAALERMSPGGGNPADWNPYVDRMPELSRCRRTWQTLREMDARGQALELVALHRLYGDVLCPPEYRKAFGDLAPLASLTDAAETARARLACETGLEREARVAEPMQRAMADSRAKLHQDLERAVKAANHVVDRIDALNRKIAADVAKAAAAPDEPVDAEVAERPARVAALARRLTAWDQHIATLEAAAQCDGVLRARIGVLAGADREVTVDDAIRHTLHRTRHDVANRSAFVVAIKGDASALSSRAHAAYQIAKGLQQDVRRGNVTPSPDAGPTVVDVVVLESRVRGSGWSST